MIWAGLLSLGCLLVGYAARVAHERYQRRQRERVLRALGGELPDWEKAARELEARAHSRALDWSTTIAAEMRDQADITRRRGRKRDRDWGC